MKQLNIYTKQVGEETWVATGVPKNENVIRVILMGDAQVNQLVPMTEDWELTEHCKTHQPSDTEILAQLENKKDSAYDTLAKIEAILEHWRESETTGV